MRDLKNVIRLHKWRLDERRVKLTTLERDLEMLKKRIAYAAEDHKNQQELKAATLLKEVHFDGQIYGQYVLSYEEKKIRLHQELEALETQIKDLIDEISVIFHELKKYELSQENAELKAQDRQNKKIQNELDELGLIIHRRRLN